MTRRLTGARIFFLLSLLSGCAGIIGVPDLALEADGTDAGGGSDSSRIDQDGNVIVDDTGTPTPTEDGTTPTGDATPVNDGSMLDDTGTPLDDGSMPMGDASPDATGSGDGGPTDGGPTDGGPTDGGPTDAAPDATSVDSGPPDSATCDLSKIATDALNCGRCGHSCLGGTCTGGVCDPTQLPVLTGAKFIYLVESGNYLYASASPNSDTGIDGIWRIDKLTGTRTRYVSIAHTDAMAIMGTTLYFNAYAAPADDAGETGGIYSCDLTAGGTTCTPKLLKATDLPGSIATDQGRVFYSDYLSQDVIGYPDGGIGTADPAGEIYYLYVQNKEAFYLQQFFTDGRVTFGRIDTAGNAPIYDYNNAAQDVGPGDLKANASSVYYSVFDYPTRGGVIRKYNRVAKTTCDLGAPADAGTPPDRPAGIYIDNQHVFWTTQGDPAGSHTGGAVSMCPIDTCCTTRDVLWTGNGEPRAITGDANYLYWVTKSTGQIWRVAKP